MADKEILKDVFYADTVTGSIDVRNPQPDLIISVNGHSFYMEIDGYGQVTITHYDVNDDDGTTIATIPTRSH
jgi:hypothetical protein